MTTRFKSTVNVDGKDLKLDVDLINLAQDTYRPGMMWRDLEINGSIESSFAYIGDDGFLVSRVADIVKKTKV